MSFLRNIRSQLFLSSSIPNLAIFRILFGGVMFYEMGRLIWLDLGTLLYITPSFHFKYPFFVKVYIFLDLQRKKHGRKIFPKFPKIVEPSNIHF